MKRSKRGNDTIKMRKKSPWAPPRKKALDRSSAVWSADVSGYTINSRSKQENIRFNKWHRAGEELENFHLEGATAGKRRKIINQTARLLREPRRYGSEKTKAVVIALRRATTQKIREERRLNTAKKMLEEQKWSTNRRKSN
ncbi:MAG: hypothetical protein WCI04_04300 [archaeon]